MTERRVVYAALDFIAVRRRDVEAFEAAGIEVIWSNYIKDGCFMFAPRPVNTELNKIELFEPALTQVSGPLIVPGLS